MRARHRPLAATALAAALLVTACSAPAAESLAASTKRPWAEVLAEAEGQTVDLWMYGGDDRGNAYVDNILAPAAADLEVTLRRVPVADTKDAMRRLLAERAAGDDDGSVDLVWVNGDNFATGKEAGAWLCDWSDDLPNMQYVGDQDPLVGEDFGVPVAGCESPWHKAQFTFAYDSARVPNPPTTVAGLLDWAEAHPGRFTYPAPPDFTGSVFVRQALYALSGGADAVPASFDVGTYDELTPTLWKRLGDLAPTLWRGGSTYPRDQVALDRLFTDGQVDFTMTYGPATLTELVEDGTFPSTTRVLSVTDGTIGNASFLAIPASSPDQAGAMVVADLALAPEQQVAKADPRVWGQFTVLDEKLLGREAARAFDRLPGSPVVPAYDVLSENAQPELSSTWVTPLDEGWRREVLGRQ